MNTQSPGHRAPSPSVRPRRAHSGEVRIIGGLWKRSKLAVPDLPGLRPTPDRVRETVFNWLGQTLAGLRVLDLYAGSGALGLEAASRGAASVLLIEQHPRCVAAIAAAAQRLGATQVQVRGADALSCAHGLARAGERFDIVFIDPPYVSAQQLAALQAVQPLVASQGLVYVETDTAELFDTLEAEGWAVWRRGRAGQVHFALLRRNTVDALAPQNP
ncbi:MAG TPA: 16S rRNA (guanine(966)-N(2))-methyltransferase RsmD [Thiomonas arsenitoxydans]|jgi:16S rRNA (guanine(966)-N(2))-methyltransferase RsmD|uniref:Methyltransferase n=1 Tax=Thiomonas intermedia (strain K12) TaxID=75379 RepID=D5X6L4_THIK1|nr:16S rRNA (guanine(966)-N(2))-methyltransferase RsmD [Thiomonas sp.]HOI66513.1 16S rRNA (guanine(966)-N(2))-methyltransferase RsmD [Thiomonas arsenitoxydans]